MKRCGLIHSAGSSTHSSGTPKRYSLNARRAFFVCGKAKHTLDVPPGQTEVTFDSLALSPTSTQIQAWIEADGGALQEVRYVELHRK